MHFSSYLGLRSLALLAFACSCTLLSGCASFEGTFTTQAPDGLDLVYECHGTHGPVVVLIHGWSCERDQWDGQVVHLRDDYRTVALDLGGHGESGKKRERWDLPTLARDVQAVIADVDRRSSYEDLVLVGHSLGGPLACMVAAARPDRVRGVVAVESLHDVTLRLTDEMLRPMVSRLEQDFTGQCERMVRGMFRRGADSAAVELVLKGTRRVSPEAALGIMRSYRDVVLSEILQRCPVPVLCINAENPKTERARNRKFLPSFEVEVISEVGHYPMLEQPHEFNRYLDGALSRLLDGATRPAAP